MTTKHGLSEKTLSQISGVLTQFPQVEKAMLFGSRAKATHKNGSDIDLALVGNHLSWQILGSIDSALDDLPLPYRFSVVMLSDRTDPDVAAHIRRVGVVIYAREPATAKP